MGLLHKDYSTLSPTFGIFTLSVTLMFFFSFFLCLSVYLPLSLSLSISPPSVSLVPLSFLFSLSFFFYLSTLIFSRSLAFCLFLLISQDLFLVFGSPGCFFFCFCCKSINVFMFTSLYSTLPISYTFFSV